MLRCRRSTVAFAESLGGATIDQTGWFKSGNPSSTQTIVAASGALRASATVFTVFLNRRVFYNNSVFDGWTPGDSPLDENAGAMEPSPDPDPFDNAKRPLLPGDSATFVNYTSYVLGLNGIMIDFPQPTPVSLADFEFRTGNTADPSTWATAAAPSLTHDLTNGRVTLLVGRRRGQERLAPGEDQGEPEHGPFRA